MINARVALIAGTTGLVGSLLVRELLECPAYERVISVVRRSSGIDHPKLDERVIDLGQLESLELPHIDDMFCALGTTIKTAGSQQAFRRVDLDYPVMLARKAKSAGAQTAAVMSSVGANETSSNFYLRTKGEMERQVEEIGFPSLYFFRPGVIVGDRNEHRPGERFGIVVSKLLVPLLIGPFCKFRSAEATMIARAMMNSALSGNSGKQICEFGKIAALAKGC